VVFGGVFRSFKNRIISPASKDTLTSAFLTCIPFISFLGYGSNTRLNKSGESGHPCLIPDMRGNGFSFSPFVMFLVAMFTFNIHTVFTTLMDAPF
jgi:hypothetical protein